MQYTNHAVKVQKLQTAKLPVHTNSNYEKNLSEFVWFSGPLESNS